MNPEDLFILRGPSHFTVNEGAQLEIGLPVTLGAFASVEVISTGRLIISPHVFFNDHCTIRCHSTITIGRNCWFGANCVILKGVTIGDNVIAGAGCVIYKDIPANTIVTAGQELQLRPRPQARYHAFTFTLSGNIEHLAYLAECLPEVAFHIVAPTNVSGHLMNFSRYENITIYPNVAREDRIRDFAEQCDIYLDINHLWESHNVLDYILDMKKPIYAFEHVAKRKDESTALIDQEEPEKMIECIKEYLGL
ncbi:DapH/DapD/GlmU-related protein [Streptococcus pluranimalium]|uniref:DapH/DapD/GlmU-related protein n=1 Tax=Streptococcus pluranimalium TaxID=82348 RepID=UPI004046BE12